MNFNAGIVDQQLTGLLERNPEWFPAGNAGQQRASAFALLCMTHYLGIPTEDALDLLADGGNDAGIDGLDVGDVEGGEFQITLFQGKYKAALEGTANFPANAVEKAVSAVRVLFDPRRPVALNDRLKPRIEEVRSLVGEGQIPRVSVVLCNNGAPWTSAAQNHIDQLLQEVPDQVEFIHFNHDSIVRILQRTRPVDVKLRLAGKVLVEDMNRMSMLVGRMPVQEVCRLFEEHGDLLLQRNVRRFLGTHSSQINAQIRDTLLSGAGNFYFYNNGITIVCDKFDHNAFQDSDHVVNVRNMQIINGGQTGMTIHRTLAKSADGTGRSESVLVRIYELPSDSKGFVDAITYATNSQHPVDLRDLKANDEVQAKLEIGVQELGYVYKRHRDESRNGPKTMTSLTVAEAVLAVWRKMPHQAKFRRSQHFSKLYGRIFNKLNAAQAILAVLIFRMAETERKRPTPADPPAFLPYASHYISMLAGAYLLRDQGLDVASINHKNFAELAAGLEAKKEDYHKQALAEIANAIERCYGSQPLSLQRLSATFRRGDLLEMLLY